MHEKLKSSTGSGKLSMTVKGILTSLIPVIMVIGQNYGIGFTQSGLQQGVQIVTGLVGAGVALRGYIRAKGYLQ